MSEPPCTDDIPEADAEWFKRAILEVRPMGMFNQAYRIAVMPYAYGQFRIQLMSAVRLDPTGRPAILRELCTYKRETMVRTVNTLRAAAEPEASCQSLVRWYNCEYPGGRIRLDNTEEDRKFDQANPNPPKGT